MCRLFGLMVEYYILKADPGIILGISLYIMITFYRAPTYSKDYADCCLCFQVIHSVLAKSLDTLLWFMDSQYNLLIMAGVFKIAPY